MSKDTKQEEYVPKSEFSIVRAIVAFFKLGEEGKLENLFNKLRKGLDRDIEALEKRVELITFTHKRDMDLLDDQIEDAETARGDAFLKVDMNSITSNADVESFIPQYWSGIELAEANVKTLMEKKAKEVEQYDEKIKLEKAEIAERKRRFAMISAKK